MTALRASFSYDTAVADFIAGMEMEGVSAVEPIAQRLSSGELIRFRCEGDGRGRRNGWAILYLDERPAGAFGNYRLGISRKWRCDGGNTLSAEERRKLQQEWIAAKHRRLEERRQCEDEAAAEALEMWRAAQPASADHPYLQRKGMGPASLRQVGSKLLVPMLDADGRLRNLQRIGPDGSKRFLRGGGTDGLFFVLGSFSRRGERACIGEGVATVAAVHRATGYPSIAAFSAKNLSAVARLWWSRRPDLDFIICADQDDHLTRNVGEEAAQSAAEEICARIAFPRREAA